MKEYSGKWESDGRVNQIIGNKVIWHTGAQEELKYSGGNIFFTRKNIDYKGTIMDRDNQILKWSDGDLWKRILDEKYSL